MKAHARVVVFIAVCLMGFFACGCQEEQASDPDIGNVRKHRLIAAENRDLQGRIADLEAEIELLKADHAKALDAKQEELEACQADRDQWKARAEKGVADEVSTVMATVMMQNEQLKAENQTLKTELAALKGEQPPAQEPNQPPLPPLPPLQ